MLKQGDTKEQHSFCVWNANDSRHHLHSFMFSSIVLVLSHVKLSIQLSFREHTSLL